MLDEIGSYASIVGVLLSGAGFYFTFRKLKRLRSVLVEKVQLRDLRIKIQQARSLASELVTQGRNEEWDSAASSCERLRPLLAEIRANRHLLAPDVRRVISNNFVAFALDLGMAIKPLGQRRFPRKTEERTRLIADVLHELAARLESDNLDAYL